MTPARRLAQLALAVLATACTDPGQVEIPRDPLADGGGAIVDGGDDDADGADRDGGEDGGDAGVAPVLLAIEANPRGAGGDAAETEALATALAAGARAAVVSRSLRDLAEGDDIAEHAALLADMGAAVHVSLEL